MKKILTYAIAVVAIAAGAMIGVKNLDSHDNLTEIQLENIAALSDDGENNDKTCTFQKVVKDEKKYKLECSGQGSQCCRLD